MNLGSLEHGKQALTFDMYLPPSPTNDEPRLPWQQQHQLRMRLGN